MRDFSNPFNDPSYYRALMLKSELTNFEKISLEGKSLACVFLTRFCSVGCPFCFFKSSPPWRKRNIEDQFFDEGIEKLIKFSRDAKLGYLLVSGGGEPLNQRQHILEIIKKVEADTIVLVTSGNWAKNYETAQKYIHDMWCALQKREYPSKVIVRVSVSEGHFIKLGVECAANIIRVFDNKYRNQDNFEVRIKSFEDDNTLVKLVQALGGSSLSLETSVLSSDNAVLVKRIPRKLHLTLESGFSILVGVSKIFSSSLNPDLSKTALLKSAVDTVEEDISICEEDFPGVVENLDGTKGIDWSINYNGNICIWQNQVRDTYKNLYEDSYEDIYATYLNDPVTYSFLEKGSKYRDGIISEVNPLVVFRAKAIGLRDSMGAILFEEEKTRLYYAIRVLQDFIKEGKYSGNSFLEWPSEILQIIKLSKNELIELYHSATHSIVCQQKKKRFDEQEWYDFLELIKLGHYQLNRQEREEALADFNCYTSKNIGSLEYIEPQHGDVIRRLIERLMYVKDAVKVNERDIAA